MLYQLINDELINAKRSFLDADEGLTASFINEFKNDQSYELIDGVIFKIHEVYAKNLI